MILFSSSLALSPLYLTIKILDLAMSMESSPCSGLLHFDVLKKKKEKTRHESIKIFVEHALHVARIRFRTQA